MGSKYFYLLLHMALFFLRNAAHGAS
uniref:Uncharacterized protein n=1 Tax=Arundo donax TaxID=35708 RepID=A0A0A8Y9V2_ARUDO